MAGKALRLSPAYQLVRAGNADPVLLSRLGHVGLPGDHGLLLPLRRGRTVKLLSPDLADLLERLQAGTIGQQDALQALGGAGGALLFDGVIESRKAGRWTSGPGALALAGPQAIDRADPGIAAVLETRERRDLAPSALGQHLYAFGRRPFGRRWIDEIGGTGAETFKAWLGLDRAPRLHQVTAHWRCSRSSEWWTWRAPSDVGGLNWKVYVNVAPSALPRALALVSEVLDFEGATAFKVAGHARAALRADKLVIYFPDRGTMRTAGRALADSLGSLPVQPLPFTAPLRGDHRVTWGMDPPRGGWMARGSWRLWLCSKVAGVMTSLRRVTEESEFLERFATRMSADGIRVDDWAPDESLFGSVGPGGSPDAGVAESAP